MYIGNTGFVREYEASIISFYILSTNVLSRALFGS